MHTPKSKYVLLKKAPRLIEGTIGQLTQVERDTICKNIQEGWINGHILLPETPYTISFNLITTRISKE